METLSIKADSILKFIVFHYFIVPNFVNVISAGSSGLYYKNLRWGLEEECGEIWIKVSNL